MDQVIGPSLIKMAFITRTVWIPETDPRCMLAQFSYGPVGATGTEKLLFNLKQISQ